MRKIIKMQLEFGQVDISSVEFDLRARDEIPKLLMGLQEIYCNTDLREEVFTILESVVPESVDVNNGRPGMELWKILVLGALRLNCNWDYDKLLEIANNHRTVRLMLGHGIYDHDETYALQTLKDNISLLTPEVLDRINQVVVNHGHKIVKKKEDQQLRGRCDSFVVETDVHYPTDINLLFDAIRKVLELIFGLCSELGITEWRQGRHHIRKVKKLFNKARKLKHSTSKDEKKKAAKKQLVIDAHRAYIELACSHLERVKQTIGILGKMDIGNMSKIMLIETFMADAKRQIDQIQRRVMEGETIPHNEKVFSIFQRHTEWISKGKAGTPQELGLRVCILEDQYGFILHHQVMEKQTDDKVAVPMVREAKKRFSDLNSCSFDKGFYTPDNQIKLRELLDHVVLPRKGKLSQKNKEIESSKDFVQARRQHSAVESAINALENHSLDRCPDHGLFGFKRYVALAVLSRNIQILGHNIQQRKLKLMQQREQRYRLAA